MKKSLKALSMFLAVLTFLSVFSCSTTVFAENYEKYDNRKAYEKKLLTETVDNTVTSSKISHEVVEKRDEFSKTFMREDGSFTTILSEKPLHKKDNGKWKDIDNELNFGSESYRNNSGAFDVEFPKTLSEKNKVSVSNGKETLSFSLNDIESSQAKLPENYNAGKNGVEAAIDKITSKITYENVDDNTDVEYIVSSDSVKENIIVADEKSLKESYSFTIEKGYLTATVDGENNVIFKNKSKKEVFRIPAPVMADAEGNLSYDIDVALSGENSAEMVLTYAPSKEWLGSAKFPVKIDPVIELPSQQSDFISDTVVTRDLTDPSAQSTNYVNSGSGAICDTVAKESMVLFKINMAAFGFLRSENVKPTSAVFYGDAIFSGNGIIEAKKINAPCDIATVTYADVGSSFLGDTVDYFISEGTPESTGEEEVTTIAHFNIINAFDGWLKGEENNGIALVAGDSSTNATMYLDDETYNTSHFTYIAVDYVDASCGSDEYEYTTQEIGRAGTAYVNTFTRGLSLKRSDISLPGNRMPADISFHYKGAYNKFIEMFNDIMGIYDDEGVIMPYGNGWLPSYMQSVITIDEKTYLAFTEEGTIVSFTKKTEEKENKTTEITFEPDALSDTGYALQLVDASSTSTDFSNLKLVAPDGSATFFNEWGFALKIKESEANSDGTYDEINITYDEETGIYVDCVTDGAGRKYQFSYGENGMLSQVACLDANNDLINAGSTQTPLKVTYSYDGEGNLIGVTYPDGKSISYTYNEDVLTKVQNIDGYNIQYTYDNLKKVTSVKEFAGTTPGNNITLTELSNRQVKVADDCTGTETYQFGTDGKLNYTFDGNGNYLKGDSAPCNDERVIKTNDYATRPVNLLKNGNTESSGAWENTQTTGVSITSSRSISSEVSYSGEKSMLVHNTSIPNGTNANSYFRQEITGLKPDTYYTISAYVKTEDVNVINVTSASGAYLHFNEYDETGIEIKHGHTETVTGTTDEEINEGWQRVSLTFETAYNCNSVKVYLCLRNATGKAYFDCVQFEKGMGTAEYNFIENGSFNYSNYKWSSASSVTVDGDTAAKLTGGMPIFTEDGNETILNDHVSSFSQNVKIYGEKGDVFSVGGWFKGAFDDNSINPAIVTDTGVSEEQATRSLAQVKVSYTYTNTTTDGEGNETSETLTDNFAVDFAPHNEGWQFAEDSFALKGDATSVDVTVIVKNIPQNTYITDVFVAKDEDSSVEEAEAEAISEEAEETCTCGCEDCAYGENCPCTGAINNDCQCPECKRKDSSTEDNFGNISSSKTTDGINYIESLSTYTSDGNFLATYTDERGNVTEYDYNTLNGVLDAIESPVGTGDETTTTSYEYDAMGNVTRVTTDGKELHYEYTNDRLTKITTENGSFTINYDSWGQVTKVNVVTPSGEMPLVEYSYGTKGKRTQVNTVTYRNSETNTNTYTYEYFNDGSVKKVLLNGAEKHNISCDNLGNITEIKNIGGRTVSYTDGGVKIYNGEGELIYKSVTTDDGSATEENYGIRFSEIEGKNSYNPDTGVSENTSGIEIAVKTGEKYRLEQKSSTDWFGRENSNTTTIYDIASETEETPATMLGKISTEYSYPTSTTDGKTSQTIEKYVNKTYNGSGDDVCVYDGYVYQYDKQNKISAEKAIDKYGNITDKYSYEYDKAGQLVRFNDAVADKTYTYTYDDNGNILTKTEYAYSTTTLGAPTDTITYSYDSQWKDKLISAGDKTISYDNIGNPKSYFGADLTWEGRNLTSFDNNVDREITYQYDENGMRYHTTVKNKEDGSEITFDYVWVDSKLISTVYTENNKTKTAKYIYNDFDEPVGMLLTDEETGVRRTYYYLKNAQGDITNIVSSSGSKMVEFTYDAWGKRTIHYQADVTNPNNIIRWFEQITACALTPFGYRGYCYDMYTDLYYLQSRYYDPNTGRFINSDDTNYLNATGTVLGCNLFAYCENDGVNNVDPKGTAVETVLDIVGIGFSLYDFINKPSWVNFGFLVWDVASAFVPFAPGSYAAKGGKLVVNVADKISDLKKTKYLTLGKYKDLKRIFKGAKNIEIHHVVEKRFYKLFTIKQSHFMSIPLDKKLHKKITKRWRNVCKYRTNYASITKKEMKQYVRAVYYDMPKLKKQALKWVDKYWKVT